MRKQAEMNGQRGERCAMSGSENVLNVDFQQNIRKDIKDIVQSGERIDDLQLNGLIIIQNPEAFCFGSDAVLLAHFAKVNRDDKVVDLGTGSGVIPIMLSGLTQARELVGFELQQNMVDMARRSVELNGLASRVKIEQRDIRDELPRDEIGYADCVVCNPPYYKIDASLQSNNIAQAIARYEVAGRLEEFVQYAGRIVKNGGRVAFVHRSERLLELSDILRKHALEPKRIQLVQSTPQKPPHLVLVESIKLAKPGLRFLPNLILNANHEENEQSEIDS